MAIEIKIRSGHTPRQVWDAIGLLQQVSRFTFDIREALVKRREKATYTGVLTVHDVRLRQSKSYCGSHAGACAVPHDRREKKPFGGKNKCLEGADWIAFNDLLNTALDGLGASADIASFVCEIRRGAARRVRYTAGGTGGEWDKSGSLEDYADFCGKEPPTTNYPEGTPGTPTWRAEKDVD